MKQPIFYCKSWFRAKKRPTEVWTEEQAKVAHCAKRPYGVLVGSVEKPFCFLEVSDKFLGVGFLDSQLRESLYYAFKEIEPGRLFLGMATYREFQGESDAIASGTTYIFEPSGVVKISKQLFDPHTEEVADAHTDVTANYANWPEFGEYDDLIRVERST